MKNLDVKQMGVQELNSEEVHEVEGGSWLRYVVNRIIFILDDIQTDPSIGMNGFYGHMGSARA